MRYDLPVQNSYWKETYLAAKATDLLPWLILRQVPHSSRVMVLSSSASQLLRNGTRQCSIGLMDAMMYINSRRVTCLKGKFAILKKEGFSRVGTPSWHLKLVIMYDAKDTSLTISALWSSDKMYPRNHLWSLTVEFLLSVKPKSGPYTNVAYSLGK